MLLHQSVDPPRRFFSQRCGGTSPPREPLLGGAFLEVWPRILPLLGGSSEPPEQGSFHRGSSRFHLMGCHQDGTSLKPRHRCLPRVSSVTPPRRENVVSPEGLLCGSLLGGPLKQLPREGPCLAPRSLSRPQPHGTLTPGSIPAREHYPEISGAVPVSSPGCFSWESPPRRRPPREPWRGSRGGITGPPRVVPSRRDLLEMRCPS